MLLLCFASRYSGMGRVADRRQEYTLVLETNTGQVSLPLHTFSSLQLDALKPHSTSQIQQSSIGYTVLCTTKSMTYYFY